jgi:hypothetical protein
MAKGRRLKTKDKRLEAEDYRLKAKGGRLKTEGYRLETTGRRLKATDRRLQTKGKGGGLDYRAGVQFPSHVSWPAGMGRPLGLWHRRRPTGAWVRAETALIRAPHRRRLGKQRQVIAVAF